MADWIKVETTSSQKIEVLTIADILDMDEHMVFGKLVILWCWADANTVDGNAQGVTKRMIDRVVGNAGFADAMLHESVGWLVQDEHGNISFPNFERHNGKGAKKRAVTNRRVSEYRTKTAEVTQEKSNCNDGSVTESVTREEKRREEKSNKDLLSVSTDAVSVLTYLNEVCGTKYKHSTKSHIENINGRLSDGHSVEDCKMVIDFKFSEWGDDPRMAGYLRPQTLFGTGKFQGYLMAAKSKPKKSKHDISDIQYTTGKF